MSDDTEQNDVEQMRQLMEMEAKEKEAAASVSVEAQPQPESIPAPVPEAQAQSTESVSTNVTPTPAKEKPIADDLKEYAQKKGINAESPEEALRAYQKLEEEFHRRNQAKHPGYLDIQNGNPAPQATPPPNWNPEPQAPMYPPPNYGYQPPMPNRRDVSKSLAEKYGMDPEDVERLMPMMVDAADAIASRRTQHIERELMDVRRQSARNSEFAELIQDPAFSDPRVRAEMHEVLKDGRLFQQGGRAYATAFQMALVNMARKQLQQGSSQESTNRPPVTAGGGNGSQNSKQTITAAIFESWSDAEQEAYIKSNGKVIPRR